MILGILTAALMLAPGFDEPGFDEQAPPPPHSHGPLYSAILSTAAEPALFEPLEEGAEPEVAEGWQLEDVEVTVIGESRHRGVLMRQGQASASELLGDFDRDSFVQSVEDQEERGRCLQGFEVWIEAGKELYAGVFGAACDEQRVDVGLELAEFTTLFYALSVDHDLIDLETVIVDGQSLFSALWRPGGGESFGLFGVSWPTFHDLAHELRKQGYRLVDLDIEIRPWEEDLAMHSLRHAPKIAGRAVVSGAWRRAEHEEWLGADYHFSQFDCAKTTLSEGRGISGIDAMTGEVSCGQDGWDPPDATEPPMHLLSVDMHGYAFFDCDRDHGGPLHDSGTAGPP